MPGFEDWDRDVYGDPVLPHCSSCGVVLACKGEDKEHESAAREATREQAALLRELAPYAQHSKGCWTPQDPPRCTCGLRALLARLPASDSGNEEKREEPHCDVCDLTADQTGEILQADGRHASCAGHVKNGGRILGRGARSTQEPQRVLVLGHEPVALQPPCLRCGFPVAQHFAPSPAPDTARGRE